MNQQRMWKKKPAGLADEYKDQTRCWLDPVKSDRNVSAGAKGDSPKADPLRRKN